MNGSLAYGAFPRISNPDKENLIKSHLAMVDFLVGRMQCQVPAFMSRDEITSAAMLGLVDAANRFDPAMGVLFKTFAEKRIRGAVMDEVRRMDWFSRNLREKHSRLCKVIEGLETRLGRMPGEDEIAEELGISQEKYADLLGEVSHLGCVSLNEMIQGDEEGLSFLEALADTDQVSAQEALETSELARTLAGHIEALNEKERLVISLLYYEELSQKEIAEVLEVSEGRVSQIRSQALAKLKTKMQRGRSPMPSVGHTP